MQMKLEALWSAGRQLDPNATFRTKRNRGLRHDWPAAVPLQSVSLRHSGQDQDHLHHSKPIADADAMPTPERDVSEPWELQGEVAAPALGTKLRRVLEVPRIAVQHPGADDDRRARGDA